MRGLRISFKIDVILRIFSINPKLIYFALCVVSPNDYCVESSGLEKIVQDAPGAHYLMGSWMHLIYHFVWLNIYSVVIFFFAQLHSNTIWFHKSEIKTTYGYLDLKIQENRLHGRKVSRLVTHKLHHEFVNNISDYCDTAIQKAYGIKQITFQVAAAKNITMNLSFRHCNLQQIQTT